MAKLSWGNPGQRFFETGIDRGVLYLPNGTAVPWTGLTGFDEDFSDDGSAPYFLDGVKYLDSQTVGDFAGTLTAITYPDEFLECEGEVLTPGGMLVNDQALKPFGLSYRTLIGNDQDDRLAYKLHLCYNLLATPTDLTHVSQNASPDALEFSWAITSLPTEAPGYAPTAHAIIDSRHMDYLLIPEIEDMLYGTEDVDPRLPLLTELIPMVKDWQKFYITDNGDGSWTVTGPDELITMTDPSTFLITDADAVFTDPDTYVFRDSY